MGQESSAGSAETGVGRKKLWADDGRKACGISSGRLQDRALDQHGCTRQRTGAAVGGAVQPAGRRNRANSPEPQTWAGKKNGTGSAERSHHVDGRSRME